MSKNGRQGRNSVKKELVECGCEEKRRNPSQFAQALLASLVTSGITARKQLDLLKKNETKQNENNNNNNKTEKVVEVLCEADPNELIFGSLAFFINNPVFKVLVKLGCFVRPSVHNMNAATQERDKTLLKRSLPEYLLDSLPFDDDSDSEDEDIADESLQCLALDDPCDEIALEDCIARSNDNIEVEDLRTATPTESSMVWCMVCQRILQGQPTGDDEDLLSHLSETTINQRTGQIQQLHATASTAFLYIQNNSDYRILQQPYADNFWRQEGYGPDPNDRCDSPKEPTGWGEPPKEEQLDWNANPEIPDVGLPPDAQGGAGPAPQDMFEIGFWGNPVNLREELKKKWIIPRLVFYCCCHF